MTDRPSNADLRKDLHKPALSNRELRDLVYRLEYPPTKSASRPTIDDVMKAIQAREQQLLTGILGELNNHALANTVDKNNHAWRVEDVVSVIQSKIGELNG